ncbi:Nitrogen permease regulator 2 [Cichlidogyrus casuarinus]|uniref:Nitrogen permease regulator 2 n=1 Tax=Cichlidogyrus casuarinus TaxID=1844966 RepID=A0ABD2QJH2_9PLAT
MHFTPRITVLYHIRLQIVKCTLKKFVRSQARLRYFVMQAVRRFATVAKFALGPSPYPKSHTDRIFSSVSHVVHPKTALCDRVFTIQESNLFIVGCPQYLTGSKYKRNGFFFNLCFVIKPTTFQNLLESSYYSQLFQEGTQLRPQAQKCYELIVDKTNKYIAECEKELNLFADGSESCNYDFISPFVEDLFKSLKFQGNCSLCLGANFSLNLEFHLRPDYSSETCQFHLLTEDLMDCANHDGLVSVTPVRDVTDDQSFVILQPPNSQQDGEEPYPGLDLTSSLLVAHVDGSRTLHELALAAKIDVPVARVCLVHLLRLGIVDAVTSSLSLWECARSFLSGKSINDYWYLQLGYYALPKISQLLFDLDLIASCTQVALLNKDQLSIDDESVGFIFFQLIVALTQPHGCYFIESLVQVASSINCQLVLFPPEHSGQEEPLELCQVITLGSRPSAYYVDLIQFVQFSELNKLIGLINCYPLSDRVLPDDKNSLKVISSLRKGCFSNEHKRLAWPPFKGHSFISNRPLDLEKEPTFDIWEGKLAWTLLRAFNSDGLRSLAQVVAMSATLPKNISNHKDKMNILRFSNPLVDLWGSVPPLNTHSSIRAHKISSTMSETYDVMRVMSMQKMLKQVPCLNSKKIL